MTGLVPVTASTADEERWTTTLRLVAEWLAGYSGHSRTTYADAIGWPIVQRVTETGDKVAVDRGYHTTRQGMTLLGWCWQHGLHPFDLKRIHVLAWIEEFTASRHPDTGEPLSKRSRAQLASAASSFYIWAMGEGHTESNPIALINRKRKNLHASKDPSPTRSLSREETQAMIATADNDPVRSVQLRSSAVIALLFGVGPRVGEMCRATLADMRVTDGRRILRAQLKGGKVHDFPVPPEVCRRIDAYLASRADINRLPVRRGTVSATTVPLIATDTGKSIDRSEVLRLVKRIAKLAGIDDPGSVHPHVARHTFITEARRQGYVTEDIQHHVGHESPTQTDRYGTRIINLQRSPAYGVAAAFEPNEQDLNSGTGHASAG